MILPDVEWFNNKLSHTDAPIESNRAYWSKTIGRVAEYVPEHERDAVLLLMAWNNGVQEGRWNWKE